MTHRKSDAVQQIKPVQRIHRDRSRRAIEAAVLQPLEARRHMSTSWQNVQIGGGGYVTGLAASTTGSAIYARTDVGGAYRWNAGASAWNPITDSLPADTNNNGYLYGIGSIAVDPANANRVFIAAGKYNYANPSGIYYTTDASVANPTWTVIDPNIRLVGNGNLRDRGERLSVDPNNSNVVYYGANNVSGGGSGIKKYVYNGASWTSSSLPIPAVGDANLGIVWVIADKNGGTVSDGTNTVSKYLYAGVFSATAGSGGVYASSDGGASWTKVTGVAVDKPSRGEVASDGTLWVTYDGTFAANGGVTKLARGATTFTTLTSPGGNIVYNGLAVDPSSASTVMVAEFTGSNRIWRSIDAGANWVLMTRTQINTEPDGTPSATRSGSNLDHIADLMINPSNASEVWASDFLGVVRTQNIQNTTAASTWYNLQKNHEEVVPLALNSSDDGAPLLAGVADVNGYVINNPDVRPTGADRFDQPTYLSTTSVDFAESTSGSSTVWARVGDLYYNDGTDGARTGGFSLNNGRDWSNFGQLDSKSISNSATAGWETFDVGPYLAAQKAMGINTVTLVVRSGAWQTNQYSMRFSSREGTNSPELLINGATPLIASADAYTNKGATTTNYGNSTSLVTQNYYNQASFTKWAYVKFDLSSVSTISTAQLRLYRMAGTDTTQFSTAIYSTPTTNWVEGDGGTDNAPTNEITWANMPTNLYAPPSGATGGRIAISATSPSNFVWHAENGAVWYSKDRGMTWARSKISGADFSLNTTTEFDIDKLALVSDRVAADTFYGYSTSGTLYRSTDGGATWASFATGIGSGAQYKIDTVPGQNAGVWFLSQNWNVASSFKYWNGTAMTSVGGITGVVDFAFGKAAPGRTNPTVFVRKSNGSYWYSVDATAGSTATWTQVTSTTINDRPRVMQGDMQTFGRFYVGTDGRGLYYIDAVSSYSWDGGAGTSSWNAPTNWSPDTVPTAWGTASFTNTGITAGQVIGLDANQTIDQLNIAATNGFTIGSGTTYGLTLAGVTRQDIAGTESSHTIAAPVTLSQNSVWSIAGSGALVASGGVAGAYTLTKAGAGQLDLGASTYTGDTTVSAGVLRAIGNGAIKGNLVVGDGTSAASFTSGSGLTDAIANNRNVTVNANASVSFGGGSENINSLVINGGTFNTNYSYINGSIAMTGGTLGGSGAIYGNHASITTNASTSTALISVSNSMYAYANSTFNVADGTAAVDLKVAGALSNGSTSNTMSKTGAGTMVLSASNSQANSTFTVSNGTLLVNNTTGSGTGKSAVSVSATSANATLGGTGAIGGVAGYTSANVTLAGSASYAATLAPGTVNETTGAHVLGTLTVGSASQANNVTINGYGRLATTVSGATNDRVTVNGNVTIAATNTTLVVNLGSSPTAASYTLLSCSGTLSGAFANVTGVPSGYTVVYSSNSIDLVQNEALLMNKLNAGQATVIRYGSPQSTGATRIASGLFNSGTEIGALALV